MQGVGARIRQEDGISRSKARPGISLRSIRCEKNLFMMKSDRTIHISRHCIVDEDNFSMKK